MALRPPPGWIYGREAWYKLSDLSQKSIFERIRQARRELRSELKLQFPFYRSAGGWVVTRDKDGNGCLPFPDVEMYREPTSILQMKMIIADIERSYPDVRQLMIIVGFHATFVRVNFYGSPYEKPDSEGNTLWAAKREIIIWERK